MSTLLNTQAVYETLLPHLNEELKACAEPYLEKALEDIEKQLRQKIGSIVIGLLEHSFSVERYGDDIKILVRHESS